MYSRFTSAVIDFAHYTPRLHPDRVSEADRDPPRTDPSWSCGWWVGGVGWGKAGQQNGLILGRSGVNQARKRGAPSLTNTHKHTRSRQLVSTLLRGVFSSVNPLRMKHFSCVKPWEVISGAESYCRNKFHVIYISVHRLYMIFMIYILYSKVKTSFSSRKACRAPVMWKYRPVLIELPLPQCPRHSLQQQLRSQFLSGSCKSSSLRLLPVLLRLKRPRLVSQHKEWL